MLSSLAVSGIISVGTFVLAIGAQLLASPSSRATGCNKASGATDRLPASPVVTARLVGINVASRKFGSILIGGSPVRGSAPVLLFFEALLPLFLVFCAATVPSILFVPLVCICLSSSFPKTPPPGVAARGEFSGGESCAGVLPICGIASTMEGRASASPKRIGEN